MDYADQDGVIRFKRFEQCTFHPDCRSVQCENCEFILCDGDDYLNVAQPLPEKSVDELDPGALFLYQDRLYVVVGIQDEDKGLYARILCAMVAYHNSGTVCGSAGWHFNTALPIEKFQLHAWVRVVDWSYLHRLFPRRSKVLDIRWAVDRLFPPMPYVQLSGICSKVLRIKQSEAEQYKDIEVMGAPSECRGLVAKSIYKQLDQVLDEAGLTVEEFNRAVCERLSSNVIYRYSLYVEPASERLYSR